jgi:hypothetical protein
MIMLAFRIGIRMRGVVFAAFIVLTGGVGAARGQQLFYEDFEDETLATNGMLNVNATNTATVANGSVSFVDTDGRASFSVVQTFSEPVMTFSFDLTAAIVPINGQRMEVILRAGVGAAHGTLANADQVVEAILFRGTDATGSRITTNGVGNDGTQTCFLIFNNKATDETFNSPIDGLPVTLMPWQYVPYMFNRVTNTYTPQPKGISNPNGGTPAREITRLGIGSSTTGDQGTFAIDNVLVMQGATFERNLVSVKPGDADGDMDVDMDDFAAIQNHFQQLVTMRSEGDLNNDGKVDFRDFRQWKSNFVPPPGAAAGSGVPEPAGAALAAGLIGAVGAVRRRGRRAA